MIARFWFKFDLAFSNYDKNKNSEKYSEIAIDYDRYNVNFNFYWLIKAKALVNRGNCFFMK